MLEDTFYIYDLDGKMAIKGTYHQDAREGLWLHYTDGAPTDTLIYHKGQCTNCYQHILTQRQLDSLRLQYQELQEELDNPGSNPDSRQHMHDLDPDEFH